MLKQNSNHSEIGYVLSVVAYREHDAMVHFFGSESGLIRLVLPGFYKQGSKQGALGLEFTKVNYRFNPRKGHLNRIIGGEKVDIYPKSRLNSQWLMMVSILCELIIKYYQEADAKDLFTILDSNLSEDSSVIEVLNIISYITKKNGFMPHVSSCVKCDSTGINAFSIEHGGFLCNNHTGIRESRDVLLLIKALYDGNDLKGHVETDDAQHALELLVDYLEYHGEVRLNSWKFYKEIGKI